jgi:hypothetical protein
MKKNTLLSIILFLLISSEIFSQESGASFCQKARVSHPLRSLGSEKSNHTGIGVDVQKYTLNLDIYNCFLTPYPHSFTAVENIDFQATQSVSAVKLNCGAASITVNSVSGAGISFLNSADTLIITLDKTYSGGENFTVNVTYNHNDYADGSFYTGGDMVFTDCEPEGARNWYPCVDKTTDKALTELTARVPTTVILGSNGILADANNTGSEIYYHWANNNQIATYLVSMAAKVSYNLDIIPWQNIANQSNPFYFYYNAGEDPSSMETVIPQVADFFSTQFCDHAFEKNGFATLNSQFSWGGMENQTLTNLCPDCWSEDLLVHEFAHQWFGDMITCGTWADVWLNEGFATYCEALWLEHKTGYTAYKNAILNDRSSYLSSNPGWAIYNSDWVDNTPDVYTLFNTAVTYDKSACFIHQLRYLLGDDTFFAFLKSYCSDPEFKYKSATSAQFNQKLNDFTGQNYDWYFNAWLMQPNHPTYQNKYSLIHNGDGTWTAFFRVNQTQTTGFFPMKLIYKTTYSDASVRYDTVFNDVNNQLFSVTSGKQPTSISFDPNNDIVLKTATLTVGVENLPSEIYGFTISPNPVKNELTYSLKLNTETSAQIEITDITGRTVQKINIKGNTADKISGTVNVEKLADGIYFSNLICNGKKTEVQKFVKQ